MRKSSPRFVSAVIRARGAAFLIALSVVVGPVLAQPVTFVSGGATHSLFIKADGTLWGMGSNSVSELSGTGEKLSPAQMATGVTLAAGGGSHTVFVKSDGTMWGVGAMAMASSVTVALSALIRRYNSPPM